MAEAVIDDVAGAAEAGEVYIFPTSFAQQRLWFLEQLNPGTPVYNLPTHMRLQGEVNVRALERSLNEVVRRHEALRTTFQSFDGEPRQVVSPAERVALPVVDLRQLEGGRRAEEAERILNEDAGRGFDLARGPLLRVTLVRQGEEEYVLLLTMHHIVSDGWSMGVLANEVEALYAAFKDNLPSPLAELPVQYADYAVWQREQLQGEALEKEIDYWRGQLAGAPPVLALPTDRTRGAALSHRAGTVRVELDAATYERLQEVCGREGVTIYMLLLAGFMVLLARHSGTDDIVVGSPVAGRGRVETEGLIGFFINTLVLRARVLPEESFRDLLGRVRETCLGAYAHQDVPFERLVEELRPARSLTHTPLFQVAFTLQNIKKRGRGEEPADAGGGKAERKETARQDAAKFDLNMALVQSGGHLRGVLEYSADLFDEPTVARMAEHYRLLLESIASDPSQRVSELRMMGDEETRRILSEWNDTRRDYPSDACVHELFREQALKSPGKVALRLGEQRLGYGELDARANRLAHYLRGLGVGPESVVGVLMERSVEMVVALLGVLKAGGAYLPLDPEYPAERLAFMLEDTGAPLVLTQQALVGRLPESAAGTVCLDAPPEELAASPADEPPAVATAENLAYVMYTSGSTGRPKGVSVTHRGIVRLVKETNYADFEGVFLHLAPISFDASTFEVWGPLLNGGELVLMPAGAASLEAIAEAVERHEVTTLWLTAALFQQMVDFHLDSLRGVRQLLAGGDTLPVGHVRKVTRALGRNKLVNGYGPTENTTFSCCHVMTSDSVIESSVPIGRPISNTRAYVLDRRLRPCPPGVPGGLYLGGDGLARGYLRRPALTAASFIPDPFSAEPGARLYRTGDLARHLAGGELEFLGRADHQVKVRGFRVELGEVEAALLAEPGVRQAVVVAREAGGAAAQLVAYVVRAGGAAAGGGEGLRAGLRGRLPEYMVPGWVVEMGELPLTPNGKIDRKALARLGPPDAAAAQDYVAPRDVVEFKVAQVWEEVLGVGSVGVRQNFFELGGHSLSAVRMMAHLRRAFGRELPLSTLFQSGTVEQLAGLLRNQPGPLHDSPLVGIHTSGTRPPFFCVHPVGGNVLCYSLLAQHLGADQPFYGLQATERGPESDEPTALGETAARYAEAIRGVQPRGPYHLGGWSLGGALAFEIARQLHARGEHVALLAMLDSWAPLKENKPWEVVRDDAKLLAHVARAYRVSLPKDFGGGLPDSDEQVERALELAKKADLVPPDVGAEWLRRLLRLHRHNLSAVLDYEPEIYAGGISLFRAGHHAPPGRVPDDWGWGRLSALPVNVCAVPGDHYTMLAEPHVRTLAARLADRLRAASGA